MANHNKRIHFRSAFIGGLVAALTVMALPAVAAEVAAALQLGQSNTANARTTLKGDVGSANLRIVNTDPDGSPLSLVSQPGEPPLKVNRKAKVKNLNADRVDGHHADDFVLAGDVAVAAHGHIRESGSIRNASANVSGVTKPGTGQYCIAFADTIAQERLESTVVGLAGGSPTVRFARMTNGQQPFTCPAGNLVIQVTDVNGSLADGRFSFMVP